MLGHSLLIEVSCCLIKLWDRKINETVLFHLLPMCSFFVVCPTRLKLIDAYAFASSILFHLQHLVYEYARKGACVALVARTEIALRAVAKTARDLGAPDTLVVPADITNVDEAKRAVEETVAHFGKREYLSPTISPLFC
jgi:hypothetical protein